MVEDIKKENLKLKGIVEAPGMLLSAAAASINIGYNAIKHQSRVDVVEKLNSNPSQIYPPTYVDWKTQLMDYFYCGGIVINAFGHSVISKHTVVNNPKFDDECLHLLYLYMVKKNIFLSQ